MKVTKETKYTLEVNQDELDVIEHSIDYLREFTSNESYFTTLTKLKKQIESIRESSSD